eukprot:TRINITY_DN7403_c0_g1_i1.p2 TRINITY_DN7403_c0_g1~~TRINITY_DN7403_c0_g1_i1.p2  ORF type:complete len:641 (+),score=126.22 TRINITY_DN7403_c0_g1_i1:2482-4404(+)
MSMHAGKDLSDKHDMERGKLMKMAVKDFIEIHEDFAGKYIPTREETTWMSEYSINPGPLMPHYGLFLPTLLFQANEQQQQWWLMRTFQMKIIGCYAQTELGHGSNVRGLQTTATFDKTTQEFVLNTPTLQSIKWWNSGIGRVATHAAVYAQLIIDGKEHGVHCFMLQIRDENHRPFPGIEVGDCGPKLGDRALDTGYLRLKDVRIPRENMLAKFQEVTPDGKYAKRQAAAKRGDGRLAYLTMMNARVGMMSAAGGVLAKAVTIAVRYSCVRHQGFADTSSTSYRSAEVAILDYGMQRYRLLKQLALAYTMKFTGRWLQDAMKRFSGGASADDLQALPELHATSAGLKGLCCFLAAEGMEDCRKCCGGHGYLLNAGIASHWADYVWQVTAEGDYVVLLLQTARFLVKSLQQAKAGQPLSTVCSYLSPLADKQFNLAAHTPAPARNASQFTDLGYLLELFKFRTLAGIVSVGAELERRVAAGLTQDQAWNACAVELCHVSRCHCFMFMLYNVKETSEKIAEPALKAVITDLCVLYACSNILDDNWTGLLAADQIRLVRTAMGQILDALRPNAVALTDAFDFPDRVLNSTIGRHDGNVYEALFEAARKSEINKVEPFDGYFDVLRPRLDVEFLKHGNSRLAKV